MNRSMIACAGALVLFLALGLAPSSAWAGGDWNDEGIDWRTLEEGVAEAKKDGKPICLVVYTETCPHCRNYSRVFHDPGVEKIAKDYVMVRVDQQRSKNVAKTHAPDGAYIPRTLFLTPDGKIATDIQVDREKYVYFYDEHDPRQIREAMKSAHPKLTKKSS